MTESTAQQDQHDVAAVLQRGDERAFRSLYARHSPALYALALRLLGERRQEAEDVVQESWIRAIGGLARFAALRAR